MSTENSGKKIREMMMDEVKETLSKLASIKPRNKAHYTMDKHGNLFVCLSATEQYPIGKMNVEECDCDFHETSVAMRVAEALEAVHGMVHPDREVRQLKELRDEQLPIMAKDLKRACDERDNYEAEMRSYLPLFKLMQEKGLGTGGDSHITNACKIIERVLGAHPYLAFDALGATLPAEYGGGMKKPEATVTYDDAPEHGMKPTPMGQLEDTPELTPEQMDAEIRNGGPFHNDDQHALREASGQAVS